MVGNKRQASDSEGEFDFVNDNKKQKTDTESVCSSTNGKEEGEIIKGAWSPEEDQQMLDAVEKHGTDWKAISQYVKGRTAKQCRDRYKLKLDPNINHGPWTPEEDELLLRYHEELGRQWTKIAKLMPGRTENSVKSRYASLLRSKTREWTDEEDNQMRELRAKNVSFEEIAKVHLPHRSEHAVKKRWERLFMRDLAKKIRSEMPSLGNNALPKGSDNMPKLNPALAAVTTSAINPKADNLGADSQAVQPSDCVYPSVMGPGSHANYPGDVPVGNFAQPRPHMAAPLPVDIKSEYPYAQTVGQHQDPAAIEARSRRQARFKRHSTSTTVMMQLIGEPLP